MFSTAAPPLPDNVVTANSTVKVEQIKVYGLGIFINDLAAMDLKAGTFYVDFQVYVLQYYQTFSTTESALEHTTSRVRCAWLSQRPLWYSSEAE